MPEIGGKSVLVHASDSHTVWIIKDAIWENRRCVADAHEIFGMLNIWSYLWFTILLCEMSSDWNIHRRCPTANERARYRAAGSSGRTFFISFYQVIQITSQYQYIFALEYTEQVQEDIYSLSLSLSLSIYIYIYIYIFIFYICVCIGYIYSIRISLYTHII